MPATDWAAVPLPDAWPDKARFRRLSNPLRIVLSLRRRRRGPVVLPDGIPGTAALPKYLLQEFHDLPNGNYSKTITRGYARAFDPLMLGTLRVARETIAAHLRGARRVLDIGAGAGHLSAALLRAGIPEVVALEPSPYLLQQAALRHRDLLCVQGVIESSSLPSASFDGAGACFVFHEIPPRQANAALAELQRILRPRAKLVIVEPSPVQWSSSRTAIWRSHGWRGLYFRALAQRVFEPFAESWHRRDAAVWLESSGFSLVEDRDEMPWRMLVATRDP
ncbi:MAG TPA: class I SAM-dependent methyltransferase [Planctomycetota bacterium]|nr:class I SAM-dependent methyltransferase [Planctomycetota bacterium]